MVRRCPRGCPPCRRCCASAPGRPPRSRSRPRPCRRCRRRCDGRWRRCGRHDAGQPFGVKAAAISRRILCAGRIHGDEAWPASRSSFGIDLEQNAFAGQEVLGSPGHLDEVGDAGPPPRSLIVRVLGTGRCAPGGATRSDGSRAVRRRSLTLLAGGRPEPEEERSAGS